MEFRFKRREYFRYKRLGKKWRKPKGMHNKVRRYFKGKGLSPRIGYGKKSKMKGMHPSGYREILISNPSELKKKNGIAVRISAKVGMRKRLEIQKKAEELGIKVLNPVEI